MKLTIYISGIIGGLLLLLRLLGVFISTLSTDILLYGGLGLLVFIFTPFLIVDKKRQDKKISAIIESHRGKTDHKKVRSEDKKTAARGWSMNNSPFRDRPSGLSWGGGNVHAANAKRGRRRRR